MPPFRFSAYTEEPNLANLIRASGQNRARAVEVGGQAAADAELASGRANAQIAQTVGNTLANLVQIPEQARRMEADAKRTAVVDRQADEALKGYADKDLIQKVLQATGNNPDATVRELRASGHNTAADTFQSHLHETRTQALKDLDAQLTVTGKQLDIARSLFPTPPTDPADEAGLAIYRDQYAKARPQISQTIGPDLSQHLPDPADPDLLSKTTKLSEWGMSAAERLQARRLAVTLAQQGVQASKEKRDADDYFTKALGTYLSTTGDQTEWDEALENMKHLGASPQTLAKFGTTFSPDAVQQAATLAEVKKEQPGSLENQIADALERGDTTEVKRLTEAARLASNARRPPEKPEKPDKPLVITPAQKAAAIRWRDGELSKLDEQYRAAQNKTPIDNFLTEQFVTPAPMTAEQLAEGKARVQASYLEQIAPPPTDNPAATTPDLGGLKPGTARRFTEGPYKGQRWMIGPNGQPTQVQ